MTYVLNVLQESSYSLMFSVGLTEMEAQYMAVEKDRKLTTCREQTAEVVHHTENLPNQT